MVETQVAQGKVSRRWGSRLFQLRNPRSHSHGENGEPKDAILVRQ